MSCKCQKCSKEYKLDLLIPDEIWSKITPSNNKESGLLCPVCIVTELEKIYGYSMFKLSDGNQLKSEDGKLPIPHVSGSLPDKEIRDFRTSNDITEDEMIEKEAAKYWQHSSDIQSKWFEKGAKWMRDLLRQ